MDHPTLAGVNADVGDRAGGVGAEEQQIARQHLALRSSGSKLLGRGARHPDAGLQVGVLHQAAAIYPAGRFAAQYIRCADQPFGGSENALARGTGVRMVARGYGRRRAAAHPGQAGQQQEQTRCPADARQDRHDKSSPTDWIATAPLGQDDSKYSDSHRAQGRADFQKTPRRLTAMRFLRRIRTGWSIVERQFIRQELP